MEGWLIFKTRSVERNNWAILDGQQLTFYKELDLVQNAAIGMTGHLLLRGSTVEKISTSEFPNGIKICGAHTQKIQFFFANTDLCATWFTALHRAIDLHIEEAERISLPKTYRKQLGLDVSVPLSTTIISKAYKKLCLKEHPDKGGNTETFNKINNAYNDLLLIQKEIEDKKNSFTIHYEAIVEMGAPGVGLGFVIVEDKIRKRILLQKIAENINIIGLSVESEGRIEAGDAIIGIDHDDCSTWLLSRLKARLSSVRVAKGSVVHFTFERRIPIVITHNNNCVKEDNTVQPQNDFFSGNNNNSPELAAQNNYCNHNNSNNNVNNSNANNNNANNNNYNNLNTDLNMFSKVNNDSSFPNNNVDIKTNLNMFAKTNKNSSSPFIKNIIDINNNINNNTSKKREDYNSSPFFDTRKINSTKKTTTTKETVINDTSNTVNNNNSNDSYNNFDIDENELKDVVFRIAYDPLYTINQSNNISSNDKRIGDTNANSTNDARKIEKNKNQQIEKRSKVSPFLLSKTLNFFRHSTDKKSNNVNISDANNSINVNNNNVNSNNNNNLNSNINHDLSNNNVKNVNINNIYDNNNYYKNINSYINFNHNFINDINSCNNQNQNVNNNVSNNNYNNNYNYNNDHNNNNYNNDNNYNNNYNNDSNINGINYNNNDNNLNYNNNSNNGMQDLDNYLNNLKTKKPEG
jgi:hypothetical protein